MHPGLFLESLAVIYKDPSPSDVPDRGGNVGVGVPLIPKYML